MSAENPILLANQQAQRLFAQAYVDLKGLVAGDCLGPSVADYVRPRSDGNIRTLKAMKKLGVRISLDDFGTGYSSLSYLRSFPFDRIKIDKSFVQEIGESREAMAIIRAITGLSSRLLIETTAEGVETEEQFRRLPEEGCSHFQGYLFGWPEAAENRVQRLARDVAAA